MTGKMTSKKKKDVFQGNISYIQEQQVLLDHPICNSYVFERLHAKKVEYINLTLRAIESSLTETNSKMKRFLMERKNLKSK